MDAKNKLRGVQVATGTPRRKRLATNRLVPDSSRFVNNQRISISNHPEDAEAEEPEATPTTSQKAREPAKGVARDFISLYADYADVFELPRKVHECIASQVIASVMNGNVTITWGATKLSFDLWVLLLSDSGQGRNTITELALEVLERAGIDGLIQNAFWGSRSAFYQQLAGSPRGLYVWPELSVVLRTLSDPQFTGAKQWFADRYDNLRTPAPITYRQTGKRQDTPPIVFGQAPRINVLATSSRDWFIDALQQEDTTGGFIPRWLIVLPGPSERVLPKPLATNQALVPGLVKKLRAISKLRGDVNLSAVEGIYDRWYRLALKRFQSQPNPALAMPFFNRLRGHVLKLAVIFEVSQSCLLKVSHGAMQRAIEAAQKLEETIFEILPTGMNREGSEVEKMAECIRRAGAAGMLRSALTIAFKHWKARDRGDRLITLIESGTIQVFRRGTPGRTASVYVHSEHLEAHGALHPDDEDGTG